MARPQYFSHGQQVEGGDPLPLLCPGETTSGVLSPVLDSLAQERPETTGEGLVKGYKDDEGTGAFILQARAKRVGPV